MKRKTVQIGDATLIHGDFADVIDSLLFDHVLTDPPYGYLKHKLDKAFDEAKLFQAVSEKMPRRGIVTLFGRGTAFYRWNTLLARHGFKFKEEMIWNKKRHSTPVTPVGRVHETISLHSKNGKIKRVKRRYEKARETDLASLRNDLKNLQAALNNGRFDEVLRYFDGDQGYGEASSYSGATLHGGFHGRNRLAGTVTGITEGVLEKSIMDEPGIKGLEHPTEKPVRLIERLLEMTSEPGDVIFDPFAGSGNIGVACLNLKRKYIGCEIDAEYFQLAKERLKMAVT